MLPPGRTPASLLLIQGSCRPGSARQRADSSVCEHPSLAQARLWVMPVTVMKLADKLGMRQDHTC